MSNSKMSQVPFHFPNPLWNGPTLTASAEALKGLRHVSTAGIDASNDDQCMVGTRVDLLKDLQDWSKDPSAPRLFWLDGMAGTGKSAVARSICYFLRENALLGGSFFCLRGDDSREDVRRILPTLALDLARQDSNYREALLHTLRHVPDVAYHTIEKQVHHLLKVPFVDKKPLSHVFVIDALDECADHKDTKALLENLLSISLQLPVKFFITSRPEAYIRSRFATSQSQGHRILRLHDIEQHLVEADIFFYLTRRLSGIRLSSDIPEMFPLDWPAAKDIKTLSRLAGKLFIYAFTVVQYIEEHNHVQRLETLTRFTVNDDGLLFKFYGPLDTIYAHVLSAALDPKLCRSAEISRTKQILAAILAIREPLVLSDLARLLGLTPFDIRVNLGRIHAVVRVPPPELDGVVSIFHKSFVDFLTTPGRAPENQLITLSVGHYGLARRCIEVMGSDLHFNISKCNTSYLPNSKQQFATISESLKYSSLNWAHHLTAAHDACTLLTLLEDVLFQKFLFWLEVLSVTGTIGLALGIVMRTLTGENTVSRFQIS